MERRTKIAIGIVVVLLLLLLAGVLYWWFMNRSKVEPVVDPSAQNNKPVAGALPTGSTTPTSVTDVTTTPVVPQPAPKVDGQAAVKRLAMAFAERFGSYSSEGNFTNITDLQTLMTASLRTWADGYVTTQRAKLVGSAQFVGVTSRALNANFSTFDEAGGVATVTVQTQRRETSSTDASGRVYYQDLTLEFLKTNGSWLVDSVKWADVSAPL